VKNGWSVAVSFVAALYTADLNMPANMSAIGLLAKLACRRNRHHNTCTKA